MSAERMAWRMARLRAMSPVEVLLHVRKRARQALDGGRFRGRGADAASADPCFPVLPAAIEAPDALCAALRAESAEIRAGHWRLFGHLPVQVDDPPRWQKDSINGRDYATLTPAARLDHRQLHGGGDIKVVWELSRWYQVVRLAQAGYVLGDEQAAATAVRWLEDWVRQNPPFRGYNWTSALETAIRLIQFAWIDGLLSEGGALGMGAEPKFASALLRLREAIVPPHVHHAWHYRSFGSSANNHLLGELAGLIVAGVRWPGTRRYGARLTRLRRLFEREVLAQFAEDGGNREQALHYHLFALEFCHHARLALSAAGMELGAPVLERLALAHEFFRTVHQRGESWDYGDSDDAVVTPFWLVELEAADEWHAWLEGRNDTEAVHYWLGAAAQELDAAWRPGQTAAAPVAHARDWRVFRQSGIVLRQHGPWVARVDVSPLGYLTTAAHGHLDALHCSLWLAGLPVVIDPGTGAYYADKDLRAHLASWEAHNGPHAAGAAEPVRLGPFLWGHPHPPPQWSVSQQGELIAELACGACRVRRRVEPVSGGWQIVDEMGAAADGVDTMRVGWQFAPGWEITGRGEREVLIERQGWRVRVSVEGAALETRLVIGAETGTQRLHGVISPRFRSTMFAPHLELHARGCACITRFTAERIEGNAG